MSDHRSFIKKKFTFKFLVNWIIFTFNLLVTFTAALTLFNSHNDTNYALLKYLYPSTVIIGFFIAFGKKKNLSIILCKILFYMFLLLISIHTFEIKSGDELMTSVILCSSDLVLIIVEYMRHNIEKESKNELKNKISMLYLTEL